MKFLVHAPVNGTPPLGSVLTPSMTRTYAGWSSRGPIFGQPGTMAVYVPDPAAVRENVNSLAAVGQFSTACAPNVIFPSIYFENAAPLEKEKAPVSRISDNQMPMPALRAPNVVVSNQYRQRLGGQRQVYQPQVVQIWRPMYRGS